VADVSASNEGGNNPAAITATTLTVNDGAPIAINDSTTIEEDSSNNIIDWDNSDTLTDNATLTTFENTSTQSGSVSDNSNGTFNYTPPSGFAGNDSFTYTICDDDTPTAACDSATISVIVNIDLDGIPDEVEGEGPNNGDANGDGKLDNTQSSVSSLPNPQNENNYVSLVSGAAECEIINTFGIVNERELKIQNEKYDFPLGLFDFSIACTDPGDSTTITFYLDKIYDTSKWVYIKYDGSVLSYANLDNVSFSTATVGNQEVTTISYVATDGKAIDEDKLSNGTIIDPSGPAVLADTLSNTGQNSLKNIMIGLFLISATTVVYWTSRQKS
jgi:hypothetical protein